MLHTHIARFDVMATVALFWEFGWKNTRLAVVNKKDGTLVTSSIAHFDESLLFTVRFLVLFLVLQDRRQEVPLKFTGSKILGGQWKRH